MAAAAGQDETTARPPGPNRRLRGTLLSAAALAAGFFSYLVYYTTLGANWHTVIPGEIYRCAQLSQAEMRHYYPRHGIRTVINLRGCCPDTDWYQEEMATVRELGLAKYDMTWSSYLWPSVQDLRMLAEVLKTCEYPVVIHCRRGSDRTGLASGLALLLHGKTDVPGARRHLSYRYGHVSFSKSNRLEIVLDLYEDWLRKQGWGHTPERLYHWIMVEYRPAHCWATIEPLEVPARLAADRPAALRFRAHNTSEMPWHFRQAANCGVHLHYALTRAEGGAMAMGGAGYFERVVPPGGSIDLTIPLPALRLPGRYQLMVDMGDEQCCWFALVGSTPLTMNLEVVAPDQLTAAGGGDATQN